MYANKTEFKNAEHLKSSLSRDGGREAFKSVRDAGRAQWKESAQMRAVEPGHGPASPASGKSLGKEAGKSESESKGYGL